MAILTILGWIGDAFAPTLLNKAPLLLLVCNPRLRNLVLVSPMVEFVPFVAVAVGRLVISDPLFYWFGRRYGDGAIRWMERRFGAGASPVLWLEKAFRKAAWPVVALIPNNMICLLAGATRMSWPAFAIVNLAGTFVRILGVRWIGVGVLRTDPLVQRVDRRQPPGAHGDHVRPHVPARRRARPAAARTRSRRRPSSRPSSVPTTASRNRDPALAAREDGAVKNVLGGTLEPCGFDPLTGFYRDGCCSTGGDDPGVHVVCARMTAEFLAFSQAQGNDLSTPMPEHGFPGLQPGDRWCLCAARWQDAFEAGRRPARLPRGDPHPGARVVLGRRAAPARARPARTLNRAPRH